MAHRTTHDRRNIDIPHGAAGAALRAPLPRRLASFVGREREIAAVRQLLRSARLITLTGAGGSGKTRLALEIAAREQSSFGHGAAWVELAPISDPGIVPDAVASVLQIRESGRSTVAALAAVLRERDVLLVLDNCEHVIDACAEMTEQLLVGCAQLRILATSRETLSVGGEVAWHVPPLSLPRAGAAAHTAVAQSEAVQLFVERARAAAPDFALDEENAGAVAQICRRLDGIPLALELAAARVRVLAPAQIAVRLDDLFALLTSSARTVVPRHQTLRATIDWSYALLTERERLLLDRLSIFAGSFSLEAAEAVCAADPLRPDDVLDMISQLVDKSLVEVVECGDSLRYRMLESVDQYGSERLAERGEVAQLQRRHLEFFVSLAEEAEPQLTGRERGAWLQKLHLESDNFREALGWSRHADVELHLRLVGLLRMLWLGRGEYREARRWLETALTLPGAEQPTRGRAATLLTAGAMAAMQMENAAGRIWLEESERLWRSFGDVRQTSYAQLYLAATLLSVDLAAAIAMLHDVRARFRTLDEPFGESIALTALGVGLQSRGDDADAIAMLEESLVVARRSGVDHNTALPLQFLASALLHQGETQRPLSLLHEAIAVLQRDPEYVYLSRTLWVLAAALLRRGDGVNAVRLLGASEALRERIGAGLADFDHVAYHETIAAARAAVPETAFWRAWSEGRRYDTERAVEFALSLGAHVQPKVTTARAAAAPLEGSAPAVATAQTGTVPALCVRALGPVAIERNGVLVAAEEWRHAKPRELLIYLLCYPQGRTREQIGSALWADASPSQVTNRFHVALHHLRKVLGCAEWVQRQRERYLVNPELTCAFDAVHFETDITAALRAASTTPAAADLLSAALDLYRGDFLDGELVGSWHCEHRDYLRRLYLDGLLALGAILFDRGSYTDAAAVYTRVTLKEDLHEEAHRRLMICRARSGERGLAIQQYRRLETLLREELDTDPEPETTALFQQLQLARPV